MHTGSSDFDALNAYLTGNTAGLQDSQLSMPGGGKTLTDAKDEHQL